MDGRIFSSAEEVKGTILSLLEDHVNKSVKGGVLRDTWIAWVCQNMDLTARVDAVNHV